MLISLLLALSEVLSARATKQIKFLYICSTFQKKRYEFIYKMNWKRKTCKNIHYDKIYLKKITKKELGCQYENPKQSVPENFWSLVLTLISILITTSQQMYANNRRKVSCGLLEAATKQPTCSNHELNTTSPKQRR